MVDFPPDDGSPHRNSPRDEEKNILTRKENDLP